MNLLRSHNLLTSGRSRLPRPLRSKPLFQPISKRLATNLSIPGQTLKLTCGRVLGYHTSGPANGTPVVYVHGHPDSGLTITGKLEKQVAKQLNIRWIGPDRPGVGLSTQYDEQTVLNYPEDIQALVNHLGLEDYYMIGTSGGTSFALACAKNLYGRGLERVGICAGVGPLECGFDSMAERQRKALEAWRDYPKEFREYYETEYVPLAQAKDTTSLAARFRKEFEESFSDDDLVTMLEEDTFNMAVKVFRQAWIQGAWAHAKGMEFHWQPWGFALEDISMPGIRLWYGGKDENTTPVMGRYMANRLNKAMYREFGGASHYTIWKDGNLQEMLRDLLGR